MSTQPVGMTDNLIKSLRDWAAAEDCDSPSWVSPMCGDAADRIESLTAERDALAGLVDRHREALLQIADRLYDGGNPQVSMEIARAALDLTTEKP